MVLEDYFFKYVDWIGRGVRIEGKVGKNRIYGCDGVGVYYFILGK